MVFQEEFTVQTSGHRDMHEITAEVETIAARSDIRNGVVHVFNIGSTGIIGTNRPGTTATAIPTFRRP